MAMTDEQRREAGHSEDQARFQVDPRQIHALGQGHAGDQDEAKTATDQDRVQDRQQMPVDPALVLPAAARDRQIGRAHV